MGHYHHSYHKKFDNGELILLGECNEFNYNYAILGMMDGNMTVLTIADLKSKRGKMNDYLKALPSRNKGKNLLVEAGFTTSCKD